MELLDLDTVRDGVQKNFARPHGICTACLVDPLNSTPVLPTGLIFSYCQHNRTGGFYESGTNRRTLLTPTSRANWETIIAQILAAPLAGGADDVRADNSCV